MIGKIYNQKINSDVSNLTNLALCFFFFFCVVKSLFSFSLLQFVYLFIYFIVFFYVQILYGLRSIFWPNIEKIGTMRTFQIGHGSQNRTV